MKKLGVALGLAASLLAGTAQAMTVQEFLSTAARIPRNPTALLRSDTRRLMDEVKTSFQTIHEEQSAARASGETPSTCMPEKISVSPDDILGRFNAVPASRRSISVTQAIREWMAERYPCRT